MRVLGERTQVANAASHRLFVLRRSDSTIWPSEAAQQQKMAKGVQAAE